MTHLLAGGLFSGQQLLEQVRRALNQLTDMDREMLLMRSYEMLSYEAIARILDIEPAAARKRYGRALLRLHRLLKADGVTESRL